MEKIIGVIKAMTAYGSDCTEYDEYWTYENIASLKQWLTTQPKVDKLTLYRGYTFDERYFQDADFKVGKVVGVDALTQLELPSFTTSLIRASNYINEYGETGLEGVVKVLFTINTHGKSFVDISHLSYYPDEHEHKCTDDVRLKVVSIKYIGNIIQIKLDELSK